VVRWTAWLSAVLAVAVLAVAGIWWLGRAVRTPSAPDLTAFSKSTVVRTADARAAQWLQQEASRLTSRARWLTVVGHALVDECSGSGRGGGLFGGGIAAGVSCERTDTWFFAVAGGAVDDMGRLERVLARTDGWGRFTPVPTGSATPPVMPMTTAAWVGPAGPRPPGGKVELDLIWVASRQELAAAALGAAQSDATADRVSYLLVIRPNLAGIARHSFSSDRHVVVASIADSYFFSTRLTPPSPVAGGR
jgi:hypothetical protein